MTIKMVLQRAFGKSSGMFRRAKPGERHDEILRKIAAENVSLGGKRVDKDSVTAELRRMGFTERDDGLESPIRRGQCLSREMIWKRARDD